MWSNPKLFKSLPGDFWCEALKSRMFIQLKVWFFAKIGAIIQKYRKVMKNETAAAGSSWCAELFYITFMPLLKNQQHRRRLLSALFVQPRQWLADPPLALWMDGEGQYTDPGRPLTVHAENNRGSCVLQVTSHATNEPCHWPQSANAITQHKHRHFESGLRKKTNNWMWQIAGLLQCPSYTEPRRRSWYRLI